jgi:hypothetical protein
LLSAVLVTEPVGTAFLVAVLVGLFIDSALSATDSLEQLRHPVAQVGELFCPS